MLIRVTLNNHPFNDERERFWVEEGQTVAQILGGHELPFLAVSDGELILPELWHQVVPSKTLLVQRIPEDRGLLRTVGFIAISVLSYGVAGAIGGFWGGVAGVGVGMAGSLALNALIPPVLPDVEGGSGPERIGAITGQSNQLGRFSPIPRLYGQKTFYPPVPMTALPFTELVGEDQYQRMMVVLGYGPLSIGGVIAGAGRALITESTSLTGNPIKIGDTAIDQFTDVEFEIGDPDDVTLYTDSYVEQTVGATINPAANPTSDDDTVTDNVTLTRTTEPDTDEIILEVFFGALFTVSDNGNTRWAKVDFQVHYSPAGAATWTLAKSFQVGSIERKPIRRGVHFKFPTPGEYDVRLTRVQTFYAREASYFADCTWTVLRSIERNVQPFNVDNTVVMALRIKATDQLGGRIDRLSVNATSVLPVWDGTSWSEEATRNPAWVYADIFTGTATRNAAPKSKVDTAALLAWGEWCGTNGLYFDEVFDAEGTVMDRAREVAAAGLGSWNVTDSALISIVRDQVQTSRMVVTPRNSFDFAMRYSFHNIPHALRVQFTDADTLERTERIVYDDGYDESNATKYEQLQTLGVSNADQAWKLGRYHLAQLRLRPETYTFGQDIQHLLLNRGDTFNLSHDVLLVGLRPARITGVTLDSDGGVIEIEVDETLYMEPGGTYGIKAQRAYDGTIVTRQVLTVSPSTQTLTFISAVDPIDSSADGLAVGDHLTFGVYGEESILAKVVSIQPQQDLRARITAVPAAEDIFDAWTGEIPDFDPVITEPIDQDLLPPVQPVITDISSDSPPSPTRAPNRRMVIAFEMPPGLVGVVIEAQVRSRETITGPGEITSDWRILGAAPSEAGVIYVLEVEEAVPYDVRIRSRRGQRVSSWTDVATHTIGTTGWEIATDQVSQNAITVRASDFDAAAADINDGATYQDIIAVSVNIGDTTTGVKAFFVYSGDLYIETDGALAFGPEISGGLRMINGVNVRAGYNWEYVPDSADEIRAHLTLSGEMDPAWWAGTGSQTLTIQGIISAFDSGDIVTAEMTNNSLEIIVTKDNA